MSRPPAPQTAPRMKRAARLCVLLCAAAAAHPAAGQQAPAPAPRPIQDNSFLIEEAYNQEAGVVQHISTFQRSPGGGWTYTFTQEWPVPGLRHQLSYTLPVQDPGGRAGAGLGDVALNYRYQLLGSGETRLALAPRVTALLPTGSAARGRGAGGAGVQVNLPLSVALADRWVTHSNAGLTLTPGARNEAGDRARTADLFAGQSLIWLARPTLNLMLEALWAREHEVLAPGTVGGSSSFVLSPGVRGAIDFPSGLQIVPGAAIPVELGAGGGVSLFLYLSFEHPFR